MNSWKNGEVEGVPLLNFQGVPRVRLLNFDEGSWGPTYKIQGGPWVPGPGVPRSRILGSWSHFYIMPRLYIRHLIKP